MRGYGFAHCSCKNSQLGAKVLQCELLNFCCRRYSRLNTVKKKKKELILKNKIGMRVFFLITSVFPSVSFPASFLFRLYLPLMVYNLINWQNLNQVSCEVFQIGVCSEIQEK